MLELWHSNHGLGIGGYTIVWPSRIFFVYVYSAPVLGLVKERVVNYFCFIILVIHDLNILNQNLINTENSLKL